MNKAKCPICKNKTVLNQGQKDLLLNKGEVLVSCPQCNNFFNYKKNISYKRPFSFVLYSILGIGNPLKKVDKELIYHNYTYIAAKHCVSKRVCIPNGPQGFVEINLPKQINTKEELVAYLKKYDNQEEFSLF